MKESLSMIRIALASLLVSLCMDAHALTESEKFHVLLDTEWEYQMHEFPEFATSTGYPGQNDRWTDTSVSAIENRKVHARDYLARLKEIAPDKLEASDSLTFDLALKQAELNVAGQRFKSELMPIDQLSGVQQNLASTIANSPQSTLKHFEDIVSRIQAAGERIDQEIGLMRLGLELGFTPPAITLRDIPEQIRNQIVAEALDSPLLNAFQAFPHHISESDRERLRAAASKAYTGSALPAFRRLHTFFVNDYLPAARESIALTDLPDGAAWYEHNIQVETTTNLTARQIHDLGLSEVKRIRAEMDEIIEETGFEGSFQEFCEYLRTDPKFYFNDAEELLAAYRDIAKRIDPGLIQLFGKLPRVPYGVKAIPSYAEKSQTTVYYQPGSPAAGRPGYFYANTYALDTRPKWEMEALTIHEAAPGHHTQISIAQELENVPEFRKWSGPTAFVEGWGLYSESLGEEIGMYQDPYSKFGQLTYEIWRAVRLVVDTGMHAFGWTREEAIDYFAENSSKPIHDITVEIDRYIVWPGQALAYKIGELKFKELRARASAQLGENFDLRAFHDACLENGAIPMDVLDSHIDDWTASQMK